MQTDEIFNRFKSQYSYYAKQVVNWYHTGPYEITLILQDGTALVYDSTHGDIMFLADRDDASDDVDVCKQKFCHNLSRIMIEKNVTQQELSTRTGLPQSLISRYVNGVQLPNLYNFRKLAKALHCSETRLANYDIYISQEGDESCSGV